MAGLPKRKLFVGNGLRRIMAGSTAIEWPRKGDGGSVKPVLAFDYGESLQRAVIVFDLP